MATKPTINSITDDYGSLSGIIQAVKHQTIKLRPFRQIIKASQNKEFIRIFQDDIIGELLVDTKRKIGLSPCF